MPNRLADEKSPYLLQHKDNPVDWYPWGREAFAKARAEDKPVFLSIGYSTCHWCHVMAHESFEDEKVARRMNEAFVAIKVDREERPDVDDLYMSVCQLMTGSGGWPLNVLLTPEKKPFHAMTYVPKEARFGRVGMLELISRLRALWEDEREKIERSAERVTSALRQAAEAPPAAGAIGEDVLEAAYEALAERFDPAHGGFGAAPKFPSPHNLIFLLRYGKRTGESHATEMVTRTLDAMRRGGVFDQLGYGFHRYSTDARWLLPHFEKMLYDQAMLAWAYTEAHQATGAACYRRTAEEVFTYVLRDLQGEEGAFFSAEDADSEGEEGKFYVWTVDAVRGTLDAETAALVIEAYGLEEAGNYVDESSRERTGTNVLHLKKPLSDLAEEKGIPMDELRRRLDAARERLLAAREGRIRPGLDDKILTDWNGLMIGALAKAARAFDAPAYAEAAGRAAAFLLKTMRDGEGRLLHRYRQGEAAIRAHLDDYAFLAHGCIELYEATFAVRWLRAALDLTDEMLAHFRDGNNGGFYLTANDAEKLLVRQKGFYDGARPSGNAVALLNLLRLARLTGRTELEQYAAHLLQAAAGQVRRQPAGFAALLLGAGFALGPAHEIVVTGTEGATDTQAMLDALRRTYLPHAVTLFRPAGEDLPEIAHVAPFVEDQRAQQGRATAYVCRHFTCEAPVTNPDEMLAVFRE